MYKCFKKYKLFLIIFLCFLIFSPALGNFFWGDDWFHLQISQVNSFREFLNFFSFSNNLQSTPFYRPISIQLFFFSFHALFGLYAFPYYLFILLIFAFNLYLIYLFIIKITLNDKISHIAVLIYGFSATNFPRLYSLSNLQEILMTTFILLSLLFYLKKSSQNILLSLIFFIISLGCKETAIILPAIIFVYEILNKKSSFLKILPYFLIIIIYFLLRLIYWDNSGKDNYVFNFSLFKAFNTLGWYILWSFGTPELLVDYIGSKFQILPRFFQDFFTISWIILSLIFFTLTSFITILVFAYKKLDRFFLFFVSFYLISLIPVLFLPWHKFAYELTLPLIGFSGAISWSIIKINKIFILSIIFLIFFAILNFFTIFLDFKRHQVVTRSNISYKVYKFFKENYPKSSQNNYFEFINDTSFVNQDWGSSKQIYQAISQSNMFKVLYKDPEYKVYYEDVEEPKPLGKKRIIISSAKFINQ